MQPMSRRRFLAGMSVAAGLVTCNRRILASSLHSPFKVGVISDEISQDLDHACYVIAKDFGLGWIELREIWGKNLQAVSDAEIREAQGILTKYGLQVTDIGSPLYKVNWPDAPPSRYSSTQDLHGAAQSTLDQQDVLLERSISLARHFHTDKVRCFDFWRIDDVKPYRAAINQTLQKAAEKAAKDKVMLLLENEFACNTATGREAAATLAAIPSLNLALNWDPGNAVMRGELDAYPNGWNVLPKNRIHHCHVKNAVKDSTGKIVWSPVDVGYVDWTAQFRALRQAGFRDAVSLETHWKEGGTPEECSRVSWRGMKKDLQQAGAL